MPWKGLNVNFQSVDGFPYGGERRCVGCKKGPVELPTTPWFIAYTDDPLGKMRCVNCQRKHNVEKGKCRCGNERVDGLQICQICQDGVVRQAPVQNENLKQKRARRKANRECRDCGNPLEEADGLRCKACALESALLQKQGREARAANGGVGKNKARI